MIRRLSIIMNTFLLLLQLPSARKSANDRPVVAEMSCLVSHFTWIGQPGHCALPTQLIGAAAGPNAGNPPFVPSCNGSNPLKFQRIFYQQSFIFIRDKQSPNTNHGNLANPRHRAFDRDCTQHTPLELMHAV